jgi:predicted MFS family arabinose efflux permease
MLMPTRIVRTLLILRPSKRRPSRPDPDSGIEPVDGEPIDRTDDHDPADGRFFYGWIMVAVTAAVLLITSGTRAAPGALLVAMERNTEWSTSQLSLAAAVGLAAYGLGGPLAGSVARRFGMRSLAIGAVTASALSLLISSRVESLWTLTLWFGFFAGVATGLLAGFLGAAVANRWFVDRRGLVVGIFGAAQSAGLLVFVPFFAATAAAFGWRRALVLGAIAAGLLIPLVVLAFREGPDSVGQAPLGGRREASTPPDADILRRAVRRPEFWLLAATFLVCGGTSNGLVGQHFIAHATDHGFDEVTAANWLAVMGVFNFVGTVVSGVLTDRFDPRRLLMVYYGFRGLSLLMLPFVHDSLSIGAFAVLFGLDYIATVPPTIMLGARIFGRHNAGVIYAWVFGAHQIGAAVAAWSAGLVRDSTGSYSWAFTTAGAIAIAAGFAALLIQEKAPKTPAAALG